MPSLDVLHDRLAELQDTSHIRESVDRLSALDSPDEAENAAAEISAELRQLEEELEILTEEILDARPLTTNSSAAARRGDSSAGGGGGADDEPYGKNKTNVGSGEGARDKTRLQEGAARLEKELRAFCVSFRRAQLAARRNIAAARRSEREQLLASYSSARMASAVSRSGASTPVSGQQQEQLPPHQSLAAQNPPPPPPPSSSPIGNRDHHQYLPRRRQKNQAAGTGGVDGEVVSSATDVTSALRRTHALIAGEVSRSAFAAQTLDESSAALRELQDSYDGLDSLLGRSRQLLGQLLTSNKSDTWYLQTALYLLLATFLWLLFRRFFYGPMWWLVWLPVRTAWRVGKGTVAAVGGGGGGSREAAGGAEMVVDGRDGSRVVVSMGAGGDTETVPTVRVGESHSAHESAGDPDSMVDEVGRMVDRAKDQFLDGHVVVDDGPGEEDAGRIKDEL